MLAGQDHIDMNIARLQKILEKKSAVPNYEIFEDQSDTVRSFYIMLFSFLVPIFAKKCIFLRRKHTRSLQKTDNAADNCSQPHHLRRISVCHYQLAKFTASYRSFFKMRQFCLKESPVVNTKCCY